MKENDELAISHPVFCKLNSAINGVYNLLLNPPQVCVDFGSIRVEDPTSLLVNCQKLAPSQISFATILIESRSE